MTDNVFVTTLEEVIKPEISGVVIGKTGAQGAQGAQGVKGDAGNAGLSAYEVDVVNGFVGTEADWLASLNAYSSYLHTQISPSTTWVINHNLNKFPSIELFSVGLVKFEGDIVHVSENQSNIYLAVATAGLAQCN